MTTPTPAQPKADAAKTRKKLLDYATIAGGIGMAAYGATALFPSLSGIFNAVVANPVGEFAMKSVAVFLGARLGTGIGLIASHAIGDRVNITNMGTRHLGAIILTLATAFGGAAIGYNLVDSHTPEARTAIAQPPAPKQ